MGLEPSHLCEQPLPSRACPHFLGVFPGTSPSAQGALPPTWHDPAGSLRVPTALLGACRSEDQQVETRTQVPSLAPKRGADVCQRDNRP